MTRETRQDDLLATHMRAMHGDPPDGWSKYQDHRWQENWHLTIHEKVDVVNIYLPRGLRKFMPIDHGHTIDEFLAFMKEGVSV